MLRVRRKSKPIFLQNKTGKADAKSIWMGGDYPVVVQSMTTTDTADADATLEQIYGLAMEGCEVVRVTVKDPPDAAGLLDELSRYYDEPFADSSAIPTYLVSRLASRGGVASVPPDQK